MAFVMSLARTKRVKYIGQDGSEVFQEDNRWHFLSAENLASQGEVDVILDLVSAVEAGQHLNVANVPPPKNTLHGLTSQRALQVQAKRLQLQDAAQRLSRGAGLLAASLDRDDTYYSQAAQLQRSWKLKASPSGAAAPLTVDVSLPFAPRGKREPAVEPLLLDRLPNGEVCIPELAGLEGGSISHEERVDGMSSNGFAEMQEPGSTANEPGPSGRGGVDAAYRLLQSRQRQVLWGAVQRLLEAEAAEVDGGGSGHVLAAELVKRATGPAQPPAAALGPLLLSLFLKAVDERGGGVLAEACGWIRFVAFHARVCASLERQAARLLDVSLSWLPVTGLMRSAVQIRIDSRPPLLLLIAGETLLLEGQAGGGAAAFMGLRNGSCGQSRVPKQESNSLLHRLRLSSGY
ncbi:hypothetical protein COCSUDRAFT_42399 [Coccomyxa subellipsoidea C-169]|uniref:Mediator complex subunit 17 n=1 Tax=Coccomyxa subellipsoidea (strain C-169) TaxID=574566 RepID=I0YWL1_COCSC|nr:hypothetical protein COCSUDRAFT_42399 [Coccomyxa subellipsoidea C-169]EIE22780.1 hypothetical protein COCSUDRAFT_42399 [Coccomyxa subellipsoidea C-169]|eukprot:XP_005647324.1 hypothetical protein COCSUDRAFT_42399 [Coccomyxa subellipsoidea C-169]